MASTTKHWRDLKRHMVAPRRVRFPCYKVRILRERLGWTQHDLAVRIGVNDRTVSRWESPGWVGAHREPMPMCALALQELWDAIDWAEDPPLSPYPLRR